ncbi:PspA/IM30 family protein [Desulfococcaceae bacterium HSG9]|nr:PspA/IM30 family protein [Desulfococcaceae bacterium HSG9]
MGIFTRFRDIVSSNINSMLDNAEDPEKMVKLMIREMEDTLVELRASCAGAMAGNMKVQRKLDEVRNRAAYWEGKAQLAVERGRDDLARQALKEKRRYAQWTDSLENEAIEHSSIVGQYKEDIRQLEDKLKAAKDKRRLLVQRQILAKRKKEARTEIRRVDSSQAVRKFEQLENRIERMEAEADMVNYGRKSSLEEELDQLETADDEIEKELLAIKSRSDKNDQISTNV